MSLQLRTATVAALQEIPGLVHGFEQRRGPAGAETREAARARVADALSVSGRLHLLTQVHGTAIHEAPWNSVPEGDAAHASIPGAILGIETADCLPVLIVDPVGRHVAAAHAGWRGTAAGVAVKALHALTAAGARVGDVRIALGPSIGVCCYEVGDELRDAFGPGGGAFFHAGPRGRAHLDVRAANRAQLEAAGVAAARIFDVAHCTACERSLYHSYRRDGPGGGRMLNFVGWARRSDSSDV